MTIYYLPSHEYIKVEGEYGLIGISEYAAKQLGAFLWKSPQQNFGNG